MTTAFDYTTGDLLNLIKLRIRYVQRSIFNEQTTRYDALLDIKLGLKEIIDNPNTSDKDKETARDYLDIVLREISDGV